MSKKATAIVAYVFGVIGVLIGILAGDKEGAKFDLNQALILGIAYIVFYVISRIPVIGLVGSIGCLAVFVLEIMGIINAAKGEEKALPLVGGIKIL